MPLLLLFLGGAGGYWCTSTLGGIGVAMCGTAFGISAGTVTALGTVGGAAAGFASGLALEHRPMSARETKATLRLVKQLTAQAKELTDLMRTARFMARLDNSRGEA